MRTVTFWETLMRKAHAVGQAKLNGSPPEEVARLEADLRSYEQAVLDSDECLLGRVDTLR